MPTVTFILGLCASGKTYLADGIIAGAKFDEGFLNDKIQHEALIAALRQGKDCVVIEIAYCLTERRQQIVTEVRAAVPGTHINWICIENDLYRANKNCRERTSKRDPEGHIKINQQYSPVYTYPDGAVVLKMWTKEG
jgi:hypothetical protein